MTSKMLFSYTILAALFSLRPAQAVEERPAYKEQLTYEITVTAPGTHSQGWHGTLYDESGHVMQVETGKKVMTDIGELVSIAPVEGQIWKPYGLISTDQKIENIIMPESWSYKLYRTNTGSRCPSWRGELLRGGSVVKPLANSESVQTPMGPFIWLEANVPHGWVHQSWKVKKSERCD